MVSLTFGLEGIGMIYIDLYVKSNKVNPASGGVFEAQLNYIPFRSVLGGDHCYWIGWEKGEAGWREWT